MTMLLWCRMSDFLFLGCDTESLSGRAGSSCVVVLKLVVHAFTTES